MIIDYENNLGWWNLGQGRSEHECDGMKHCGTPANVDNWDTLSLREEVSDDLVIPHVTAIFNKKNNHINEIRGPKNNYPSEKYYSYIADLLMKDFVEGKESPGYSPETDFSIKNLPNWRSLVQEKPSLLTIDEYVHEFGVDDYVKSFFNNLIIAENMLIITGHIDHEIEPEKIVNEVRKRIKDEEWHELLTITQENQIIRTFKQYTNNLDIKNLEEEYPTLYQNIDDIINEWITEFLDSQEEEIIEDESNYLVPTIDVEEDDGPETFSLLDHNIHYELEISSTSSWGEIRVDFEAFIRIIVKESDIDLNEGFDVDADIKFNPDVEKVVMGIEDKLKETFENNNEIVDLINSEIKEYFEE